MMKSDGVVYDILDADDEVGKSQYSPIKLMKHLKALTCCSVST